MTPRALVFILLLLSLHAHAQSPADNLDGLNTQAYLALMDGDRALREMSAAEARDFYTKALGFYREIQRLDPGYKALIVGVRIADLENKLADLPVNGAGPGPSESQTAGTGEDYKQLYISAKEESLQLTTRLLGVEKRGVDLERALREREQTLEAQRRELANVNRQLKEGMGESSQEIAKLRRDLQDLRKFNALLQERSTELEQGFHASREALGKVREDFAAKDLELQKLRGEYADLVEDLTRTRTDGTQEMDRMRIMLLQREDFLKQVQAEALAAQHAAELSDKELSLAQAQLLRVGQELAEAKLKWGQAQTNLVVSQAQTVEQAESLAEMDLALRSASAEADMLREKIAVGEATIGNLERTLLETQKMAETNKILTLRIRELEEGGAGMETAWQAERERMEAQLSAISEQLNQMTLLRREVATLSQEDTNMVAQVQALEAQVREQAVLMQRLTQDADVSRGEREQLSIRLEAMRNERIDLLSAMQEKDEQLITLITRTGDQLPGGTANAWRIPLETLSPQRTPVDLQAPGGHVLRVEFPADPQLPPSIRLLP